MFFQTPYDIRKIVESRTLQAERRAEKQRLLAEADAARGGGVWLQVSALLHRAVSPLEPACRRLEQAEAQPSFWIAEQVGARGCSYILDAA